MVEGAPSRIFCGPKPTRFVRERAGFGLRPGHQQEWVERYVGAKSESVMPCDHKVAVDRRASEQRQSSRATSSIPAADSGRSLIKNKLGIHSTAEMAHLALRHGLLPTDNP